MFELQLAAFAACLAEIVAPPPRTPRSSSLRAQVPSQQQPGVVLLGKLAQLGEQLRMFLARLFQVFEHSQPHFQRSWSRKSRIISTS